MASVNKAILIGNLGRDPEIRYTQSGEPIANFSLATSERWTGRSGEKQERTEWHRVEVFGKTAQVVRDYLTARGVAADRLIPASFGEKYPAFSNATEKGRRANRWVELVPVP